MGEKVAVLGAGVAGMTAAHELAKRGFEVHVYERREIPGGKARSFNGPNGLPAEHGFRFFPGFYKHLHHTMKNIPYRDGRGVVRDNLKPTKDVQVLQEHAAPIDLPTHLWRWDTVFRRNIRLGAPHVFTASFGLSRPGYSAKRSASAEVPHHAWSNAGRLGGPTRMTRASPVK